MIESAYDVIVLGMSLAGLAAALRGSESGARVAILDYIPDTGNPLEIPFVGPNALSDVRMNGAEFVRLLLADIRKRGGAVDAAIFADSVSVQGEQVVVSFGQSSYTGAALIFAPNGSEPGDHAPVPVRLGGFGLSYSAGSDHISFRGSAVAVYGNSFRAVEQAWIAARVAAATHVLLRESAIDGDPNLLAELQHRDNVSFYTSAALTGVHTTVSGRLEAINAQTSGGAVTLSVAGLFIANHLVLDKTILPTESPEYPIVPAGLAAGINYWKHAELIDDGRRAADVVLSHIRA